MDFETPEGHEPDQITDARQSRRRMLRAVFYFSCSTIILAALFVALVSASAPPSDDARIVVTEDDGTQIASDWTIKALRQACAAQRLETPSWHWSPFRWSAIGLRCVFQNRNTGLPLTLVWQFEELGTNAAGNQLASLSGISVDGAEKDASVASYLLITVLNTRH